MLISPSFCLEGIGSENCTGTEIGWKHKAVKDNRSVLKPDNEGAVLWPRTRCPPCALFHTYNVFTAGCPFGALVNMHAPNQRPGSQAGNSRSCPFPPASIRRTPANCAPTIWGDCWGPALPGTAHGHQGQSRRIRFECHCDGLFPRVQNFVPGGRKMYPQETVWQYFLPFKAVVALAHWDRATRLLPSGFEGGSQKPRV